MQLARLRRAERVVLLIHMLLSGHITSVTQVTSMLVSWTHSTILEHKMLNTCVCFVLPSQNRSMTISRLLILGLRYPPYHVCSLRQEECTLMGLGCTKGQIADSLCQYMNILITCRKVCCFHAVMRSAWSSRKLNEVHAVAGQQA